MPERAVWWLGLLALGIALAACDGAPDAPESATIPAPAPVVTVTATITAIATPIPPPSPPTAMASPPPAPAPPERWQPDIVEIDSDLFERLEYEPGEAITEYGLFFLDVETGRVEGWRKRGADVPWQASYSIPFGGRFLGLWTDPFAPPVAPYLHDRRTGRTFVWDWEAYPLEEFATERGERLIVERADDSPGQYVVLDGNLSPVAWFSLPTGGQEFWMNPAGDCVLAFDGRALHVIDLVAGQTVLVDTPAGTGPLHVSGDYVVPEKVSLFSGGFAFIGRDMAGKEQCRVARYDWAATVLSDIAFRCAGVLPPISLSPNGRMIASETFTDTYPDKGPGTYYALTMLSIFDTITGEALVRATNVLLDLPGGLGLVHTTPWIADSSGIVVTVSAPKGSEGQRRSRILGIDGRWHPSPSIRDEPSVHEAWYPPYMVSGLHDPSLFLFIRGTVVSRSDEVLASPNIDFPAIMPPTWGFVCYSAWWNTSREVGLRIYGCGYTSLSGVLPLLPPVIKTPPFDERLLMAVTTSEACAGLREEPSAEATRIACLPDATVVELLASDGVESYADGYPVTIVSDPDYYYFVRDQPGCGRDSPCLWLRVRDADGAEGWMLADSLRWAP